jgi:hypothetical protein
MVDGFLMGGRVEGWKGGRVEFKLLKINPLEKQRNN